MLHVEARFVLLLRLAAQLCLLDVAQRFQLLLGFGEPRLRILQHKLVLLAHHSREKFGWHDVELGPPNVVARLRHVGLRLLLLNTELRPRLADFLLRLLELGAPVVERTFDGHRIEPDDDIAFFDRHAVFSELDDLKVSSAGRRHRQRDRTHGLDLAAYLQIVDELAFDDGRGRHVDRRAAAKRAAHARNGADDGDASDRADDRAFVSAPHAAAP